VDQTLEEDDAQQTAGPSRHANAMIYDREEDPQIEVVHPTAGRVIRMDATVHERWRRQFAGEYEDTVMKDVDDVEDDEKAKYHPFASELDWRLACWAVQEGIGHKSFDRLVAIPGVSFRIKDWMDSVELQLTDANFNR
jgi:hypothetical protein